LGCDAGVCVNDLRQARPLRLHLFKPSGSRGKNFGLGFWIVAGFKKFIAHFGNHGNKIK